MTAREMEREFQQSAAFIDAIEKNNISIISEDVQFFLNEAQHSFINLRLNNIKNKIDNTQKDLDEIRTLLVKRASLTIDNALSTTEFKVYTLPSDYNFLISDYTFTTHCAVTRQYQNRLLSSEKLVEALHSTHTKPVYNSPISELIDNKIYIYIDWDLTFSISSVSIDYIRDWLEIDLLAGSPVTSELDPNVHRDIVQLAVTIFLEAIQSGRFKTSAEKNLIVEKIK